MKRLVVRAARQLQWEDVPLALPGAGEVRVTTLFSAISVSSELSVVEGLPGWEYPSKLGYQTLGVVTQVGESVPLAVGQRVVTMLGHASEGLHQVERLFPVPAQVADRVALCLILGEETHKGIRKVKPALHERVLVAGAGLLGLLTIFNLTRRGFTDVTVLEPDEGRRALARTFGAKEVCRPGSLPHAAFDVGFECSASPAGFAELLGHLRPGGRCAVLSDGNWGSLVLPPEFHSRELTLVASSDGEDYHAYARWLWQNADPVLESLFQLVVTPEALIGTFGRLRDSPRPVSVVVDWQSAPHPGL